MEEKDSKQEALEVLKVYLNKATQKGAFDLSETQNIVNSIITLDKEFNQ